jgi:carboxymethylenebutenolidase
MTSIFETMAVGVSDGTSLPVPTLDLTPGIRGRLLYQVGEDDALINAGQREQMEAALRCAGTGHELVSYPGAEYAFCWPGTPPVRPARNRPARNQPGRAGGRTPRR